MGLTLQEFDPMEEPENAAHADASLQELEPMDIDEDAKSLQEEFPLQLFLSITPLEAWQEEVPIR